MQVSLASSAAHQATDESHRDTTSNNDAAGKCRFLSRDGALAVVFAGLTPQTRSAPPPVVDARAGVVRRAGDVGPGGVLAVLAGARAALAAALGVGVHCAAPGDGRESQSHVMTVLTIMIVML